MLVNNSFFLSALFSLLILSKVCATSFVEASLFSSVATSFVEASLLSFVATSFVEASLLSFVE